MLSRRGLIVGACGAALAACRTRRDGVVRIGFMTNLTHAPVIAGLSSGRLERALGIRVEVRTFRAGPRVVEALVGDAIDVGVAGPSAIIFTHARHGAGMLRVLSGCASGGASFVVRPDSGIRGPTDLRGKMLATPQIGTTQDIALRKYLRAHGYEAAERGGTVTVHALDATTILAEMKRGRIDGAWLPEPWATRLVVQANGARLIDERDLWPARRFPSALVAARGDFARDNPSLAAKIAAALSDEVDRALRFPIETCDVAAAELARLLGKALPRDLLLEAWRWIDFTGDPMPDAVDAIGRDATDLGLAPPSNCHTLFAAPALRTVTVSGT